MSAVMVAETIYRGANQPKHIHDRLVRWGAWARCAQPGAEGTSEGYMRERLDHAHDSEPTAEIEATDRAVAKMKVARPDYWKPFSRYYLNPTELSEYEIALDLGYTIERVSAMLRQARYMVEYQLHIVTRSVP